MGHSLAGAGTGVDLVVAQTAVAEEDIVLDLVVDVDGFAGMANGFAEDIAPGVNIDPEVDTGLEVGIDPEVGTAPVDIGLAENTVPEEDKTQAEIAGIQALGRLNFC